MSKIVFVAAGLLAPCSLFALGLHLGSAQAPKGYITITNTSNKAITFKELRDFDSDKFSCNGTKQKEGNSFALAANGAAVTCEVYPGFGSPIEKFELYTQGNSQNVEKYNFYYGNAKYKLNQSAEGTQSVNYTANRLSKKRFSINVT